MIPSAATWNHGAAPIWSASPSFGAHTEVRWESPCEAMFEYLARHDPARLLVLANSLQPAHLTHAAEWIGRSRDPRAGQVLANLLRHPSALVREGAIIGLESLGVAALDQFKSLLVERALEGSEPSPGVRATARGALSLLAFL